jgi:4a-hydroxytetrahydrobiopterin dehydratase
MTSDLATKHCVPCEGGTPPLPEEQARRLLNGIPGWALADGKLARRYKFRDFAGAMRFVNTIAGIAESEGHHPDICVSWNRVSLELVTHSIGGLSENDFIMAAKISEAKEGGAST